MKKRSAQQRINFWFGGPPEGLSYSIREHFGAAVGKMSSCAVRPHFFPRRRVLPSSRKLPKLLCRKVSEKIVEQLRQVEPECVLAAKRISVGWLQSGVGA
jgi:hypothetical protein